MQVYDNDKMYERCLPWVNRIFRGSFRHIRYVGRENLPRDGAILFAPNHCNALIDALCVLAIDDHRKVFAARADIFRNPRAARILSWLKIIPIRRIRDGLDEVRKNDETQQLAVDTLVHGVPFCMMPEGTHRPSYELMPLKKGIFRIALAANEVLTDKPVYIVPINLHYDEFFHLWNDVTVTIGEPINVSVYAQQHTQQSRPEQVNELLAELTTRMNVIIPHRAERPTENDKDMTLLKNIGVGTLLLISGVGALLCYVLTLPIQMARPIIRRKVKDPCFRNSVQFVVQLLCILLSLGLCYLPMIAVEEWMWQYRHLQLKTKN